MPPTWWKITGGVGKHLDIQISSFLQIIFCFLAQWYLNTCECRIRHTLCCLQIIRLQNYSRIWHEIFCKSSQGIHIPWLATVVSAGVLILTWQNKQQIKTNQRQSMVSLTLANSDCLLAKKFVVSPCDESQLSNLLTLLPRLVKHGTQVLLTTSLLKNPPQSKCSCYQHPATFQRGRKHLATTEGLKVEVSLTLTGQWQPSQGMTPGASLDCPSPGTMTELPRDRNFSGGNTSNV